MDQKVKLIIIGLIIVTVVSFALLIQVSGAKQQLMRERDELKTENTTLMANVDKLRGDMRNYENRIASLTSELDNASRQKADMEKRYDLVNKAREELIQKLKDLQSKQADAQVVRPITTSDNNDAYWASVLKAKNDLEFQLNSVRSDLKSLQITNEQLQRDKSNIELDLNNLKREKEDLKRQLEYSKNLSDSIARELVREKNDKSQVQDNDKLLKNENALLTRQLQSLNNRKITLDRKIQELQEGKNTLERRLSEMELMLTDKVSQMDGFKEKIEAVAQSGSGNKDTVELPAIVVRPQGDRPTKSGNPDAGLVGRVLAVNKENNFIIVDLGQDSGIRVGDAFKIYNDEKPVASVEVIQVRRGISACDIKRTTSPIQIGDIVR
ncbi:MAG: hypothetical protein NTZ63_06370 [Candidatus Omnitrophica bacterium]|nr:hypothetical protein [Candidatus Omnitrophota bacterium]